MKVKICPICKQEKSIKEFYKNKQRKDGLAYRCKDCSKKYLAKYKDKKPIYAKNYYLKHRQKRLKQSRKDTKKLRQRAFEVIANGKEVKCNKHNKWHCCGNRADTDFLSFDHIYGNGFKHRLKIGEGPRHLYLWIVKCPKLARKYIQILCMNAQMKKTRLNKEHRSATNEKPKII